ncbi:MAG: hypothetical protein QOG13_719 [Sphingomonadales bacterium]|jgi:uncharacterized protein YneF (UPF0154 family)|nr:hypothetical protein [Sphingomonadales bacterium]MEA3042760.1 hypothetical protein [Sphingomonadales bacterium]
MLALIQFNLVPLGVALLIGIVTGRWMSRRAAPPPQAGDSNPS